MTQPTITDADRELLHQIAINLRDGRSRYERECLAAAHRELGRVEGATAMPEPLGAWKLGTRLRKKSGSSWQGRVVGYYSTNLTPLGYAVESEREPGSVQIYPASALEALDPKELPK